jgi:Flp pilus assembly protein TadD
MVKRFSSPALAALCVLFLSGCLELVRRPASSADAPGGSPAGERRLPEEPAAGKDGAAGPEAIRQPAREVGPERERSARGRAQAQTIRQVNEYVLWCIENSMWNEARSHLERALARDSLSTSIHNNLAVVYEHFGLVDRAAELYRRARELDPDNDYYESNLQRLEALQQAAEDTSGHFDIFELKQRIPGPRRDPYERRRPLFEGE